MRLPSIVLLILLSFSTGLAQLKPIVEDRGNFGLHVVNDQILVHRYVERENQLRIVGFEHTQLLDLTNFKVIDTHAIDLPHTGYRTGFNQHDWIISPDGRRMVLLGLKEARNGAFVVDLETGKRIARLDRPDEIYGAVWTDDGKTLLTLNARFINSRTKALNVSFWNGETLEYRHNISVENVTWMHLSNDGARFFAASGNSAIRIWNTRTGEVEKTIPFDDGRFRPKTREIAISPDGRFLLMVNKHKSNSSEHRLLAWEINGGINPIYELKPQPKIDDSRIVFSPDSNHFALDTGRNLQIYETKTGKLKAELVDVELPSWGWLDNDVLASVDYKAKSFFEEGKMLKAFDANDGRLLFKQRLAYSVGEDPGSLSMYVKDTIVTNDTTLRPHPTHRFFLTTDNQFAKIFDSRTGELLQTVVHPLIKIDLMGRQKMTDGKTVLSADWSKDGKALYVFSSNHQSVSLWKLIE